MSNVASESDYRHAREVLHQRWSLRKKTGLALEIVGAYVRARWLVARRDFPTALAAARTMKAASTLPVLDQQLVGVRLGRGIERTLGRLPADSRCLIKSFVLTRLLARRGIESEFIIGVRRAPDFQAHAWVEKDGVPLLDDGGGTFTRLAELDAGSSFSPP